MDTIRRGNATEAAVLNAFVKADWHVWTPFGDGAACDLIADWRNRLIRVQCKSGWIREGCVIFNAYATDHGHGPGSYLGRADVFGVALPDANDIFLIPVCEVGMSKTSLRLKPTLNNQRKKVRLADPYRFENWDPEDLIRRVEGVAPPVVL
jgi:hypothetical protein